MNQNNDGDEQNTQNDPIYPGGPQPPEHQVANVGVGPLCPLLPLLMPGQLAMVPRPQNYIAIPAPPPGYFEGQIAPPSIAELTSEEFIKFLERRFVIAEDITFRNRNRNCFRKLQNLCIQAKSEILKPSGTLINNIRSKGLPWATTDFIYAFVRLINCWHIMRGYWDNRGVLSGQIGEEVFAEFGPCFLEWEKQTKEMANHLSQIFFNLDVLNAASSGASVSVAEDNSTDGL